MAEEAVGSFPYERWAIEIRDVLVGSGVDAQVSYAGPRAYPVFINEKDSAKAKKVLSEIGYFECNIGSRASMMGALDWHPDHEEFESDPDLEELRDDLKKAVESTIETYADRGLAEGWSYAGGEDDWVVAEFGDWTAVNGDLVDEIPEPPEGFRLTDRGGRIPTSEAELEMSHIIRRVGRLQEFAKFDKDLVNNLLNDIWGEDYKGRQLVYVTRSGSSEIYEKESHGE